MPQHISDAVMTYAMFVSGISAVLFWASVFIYLLVAWKSLTNPGGRSHPADPYIVLLVLFNFALLLSLICFSFTLGPDVNNHVRDILRLITYTVVLVSSIVILTSIVALQIRGYRKRHSSPDQEETHGEVRGDFDADSD